MNDICIYRLLLAGEAGEDEVNAMSPLQVALERTGEASTWLIACTDQSGLIGLMRQLHGLGFVFLSMSREENRTRQFGRGEP